MTEPYDENHTNVDHTISNDFHHAFIGSGDDTASIQPVNEKIPNNNSVVNWAAGGSGTGGDGDNSSDADGSSNYLEIGAITPKTNIVTTNTTNSFIELPITLQSTISNANTFQSMEFNQEPPKIIEDIDNKSTNYPMSFNETHQNIQSNEEPTTITTDNTTATHSSALLDISDNKISEHHEISTVETAATVCTNTWTPTTTDTVKITEEAADIVDDQIITTENAIPELISATKSIHFKETEESEIVVSPKLNDSETSVTENDISNVECSEIVHREVKILKGRKRIGKLLNDDDDDDDDDIDEKLEAERQRLLEISTTPPPTSPSQLISSKLSLNSLETPTKTSYLQHLNDNKMNENDDDDQRYSEEALSILRKKEKPGPKSKKPSTALLKEMQARALIRNAIVIPAIVDQEHETNKHKRKNRIFDSDDDDDDDENDGGGVDNDDDFDNQLGINNFNTIDDIGMLTGCESSTDGNLANGVGILINENNDCDDEHFNNHEGINIEQIEKFISIENPIILESDDQEINKSNDELNIKTSVDDGDDESDVVVVKEEDDIKEDGQDERTVKIETLEKRREVIKVKGVNELMNVDCIKLEKNESKMITNQLKNDVVSRDSGNSTDSGYNHQHHRQNQQQQEDAIEKKHKIEINHDKNEDDNDNDNVIDDNDDEDDIEPIIPIVELLKDPSSSTTEDEFIPNDIYFGTPDKAPVSTQYRGRGRPRGRPPVHTSLTRGNSKKSNRGGRSFNKRERFIDNRSPSSSGSSSSESSSNDDSSSSSSSDSDSEENRRRRRKRKIQKQNKRSSSGGNKRKTTKVIYYQPDTMNRPPFRQRHHGFSSTSSAFHHGSNKLKKKSDRFYDKSRDIPNDVYFGDVNVPLHILHSYGGSSDESDSGAAKKRIISSSQSNAASSRGSGGNMSYSYATRGRGRGGNSYMPLPPPAPRPMPKVYHISAPSSSSVKRGRPPSSISPNGDSLIKRMKKCLRAAGLKKIKFNKLWEGCKSNQQRANKIVELLHEKGLEGEPTIAKCRQLRIEIQAKREIEDLDPNLILTAEGRTTRSSIRRNYKEDDNNELDPNNRLQYANLNEHNQTIHQLQNDLPQEPEVMIKLKKVIDSDSDFD